MKRTLRNNLGLLLSSALILPFTAGAQTGSRLPVEAGGKGQMAPMAVSPFAPNAILTESFDVLAGTAPNQCATGWTCDNNSSPLGVTNWSQTLAVFPPQAGAGFISANFNNTTGGAGTISNWLISPQVNFATGATLRFWTRTTTGGPYPDRLQVRISTAGASLNNGTLATDVGDFTTLVLDINPSLLDGAGTCPPAAGPYPDAWCEIVLTNVQGIPTSGTGRIAFRYFVTNGGPTGANSNFIGIDTFSYNDTPPLPPPTTPLQLFDGVTAPAQPAGWTATSNTAANWATATPGTPAAVSAPNVEAVTGNLAGTDALLTSETFVVTAVPSQLGFSRSAAAPGLENGFDGMVLEVSVNGGAFTDAIAAGGTFSAGGYNGTISVNFASPILGRAAWTGTQAAFTQTIYQLPATATVGSQVQFRWRMATDSSVASGVVQVDSVVTSGLTQPADLSVAITDSPDPVTAGANLTYSVTVSNAGPGPATDASFSLPLPAGTTYVSATPSAGGTCNAASPVVCTWAGATAAGTTRTASVVALVGANVATGSVLSATVTTTGTSVDLNAGNNSATTTTSVNTSANLAAALTSSAAQVLVNVPVTFTATSTNLGPSDAQGVVLSVTLSPDFRYTGHTASAGATCTNPQVGVSGVISCTWAGATAPGAVRTLAVVAFSNNENSNTVTAATSSGTPDPANANNTAAVTVQVGQLVEEIPTMGRNALLLMGLMLALAGFVAIRRNS